MAVTYYYGDPWQFRGGISTPGDEKSQLDYWFYPNRVYMEEVRQESAKQEPEASKKDGKGKGGGGGGGGDATNESGKQKNETKKEPDNKPKVIELKVKLCCDACARKVRKKIQKLEGVETRGVICDVDENKVTVRGTTKPETVLKQAQKVKRDAEMWPQKKKEPEKKKDDKKHDEKNKD